MKPCDIAITGTGAVCALGSCPSDIQQALYAPCCQRKLSSASLLDNQALDFPFFAVDDALWHNGRKKSGEDTLHLGLLAARQALLQSAYPTSEMAVIAGTTSGTALHFLQGYAKSRQGLPRTPDCDDYLVSNPALALSLNLQLKGPQITISNACVSGTDALGMAADMIACGQCSAVLCGGMDALSIVPHTGFSRLLIYDSAPCRPFDRTRQGLNLGEGAAFVVLEKASVARARGAKILGYIAGYGSKSDAHHFTAPHPYGQGLESAVNEALTRAGISESELAFINVHGTGTRENDKIEGQTLHRMFPHVPLWATKGLTGHTLGAAGALEALFTLMALKQGIVPASTGFQNPDPEIGAAPTQIQTSFSQKAALSTSLGFGGSNSALVICVD
jgi:3-oxoacyl-[acyl-carrier-protein] synthase-1/3-oxoacyl-[acyl-carrier-protein] synthase II